MIEQQLELPTLGNIDNAMTQDKINTLLSNRAVDIEMMEYYQIVTKLYKDMATRLEFEADWYSSSLKYDAWAMFDNHHTIIEFKKAEAEQLAEQLSKAIHSQSEQIAILES